MASLNGPGAFGLVGSVTFAVAGIGAWPHATAEPERADLARMGVSADVSRSGAATAHLATTLRRNAVW